MAKSQNFEINEKDLHSFLGLGLNVLIQGPHGVGKTEVVKKVWTAAGLQWKYLSASTMDPFLDFIGVPRASEKDTSGNQYLEMIMPKDFAEDTVEAIFFDEFNRAPDKVINAVMELIQFKSINGRKFNNLKTVWAAINPYTEDETYAVSQLDPAVRDRFHIHIEVKKDFISLPYFLKQHGDIATIFIQWWKEHENYNRISPRRLDYAITNYKNGVDLAYILPIESNISDLEERLVNFANPTVSFPVQESVSVQDEENIQTLKRAEEAFIKLEKFALTINETAEIIEKILENKTHLLNYVHPVYINHFLLLAPQAEQKMMSQKLLDNFDSRINVNFDKFAKSVKIYLKSIADKDSKVYKIYLKDVV